MKHPSSLCRLALLAAVVISSAAMTCSHTLRSTLATPPTPQQMAELWVEPADLEARDLFHGPGGRELMPESDVAYHFKKLDTSGKSRGFDVTDRRGREWSVKLGPESQTEVVASRILWAIGYHQPPTYYVPRWRLVGSLTSEFQGAQQPGRFRAELPGQKVVGEWSWHRNPFVGTRPYRGLVIVNVMINNWDVKKLQNKVYEVDRPVNDVRRWFVVRDLGAAFGKPRWPSGTKNDIDDFEKHGFIKRVRDGRFEFAYSGRHDFLYRDLTAADLGWACGLLSRITPAQWHDAFRAGGYDEATASRYIRRLHEKIDEGLRAADEGGRRAAR